MKTLTCLALVVAAALALAATVAQAAPTVTEFPLPTAAAAPQDIVLGPDGKLWFAESGIDKVGRIDPANPGIVEEFATKDANGGPFGITVGPDGNIWFTERDDNEIGMMPVGNPAAVQEFSLGGVLNSPQGIATGPDGNLWVVSANNDKVVRVTTAGVKVEEIAVTGYGPRFIAPGPGDTMWVAGFGGKIGRIEGTGGAATTFDVSSAWDIVQGPDGNMWFTAPNSKIGRITPAGTVTELPAPTPAGDPFGIAVGPDGALWFAQAVANSIGRAATDGTLAELGGLSAAARPEYIAAGPQNTLWFTEKDGNRVGRISGIDLPAAPVPAPPATPSPAPPLDVTRPVVSRLSLSRRVVRSGRRTTARFTLSEPATMRFRIDRARPGRLSKGRCVKPRRSLRRKRRCARYRPVVAFRRQGTAGRNRVVLRTRVHGKPLKPGRYRLLVRATDAAENRSASRRLKLRVTSPPTRRARR